jgi:UDP-glucose 4-epimerase
MESAKILITGAAGFIGYHLSIYLAARKNKIIGLDNFDHPCGAPINCIRGDVRDKNLVDELVKEADYIYHLAAQINVDRSYAEKELTFDVNVGGTENILKACRKYGKKMLLASSVEVYGTAKTDSIRESHQINPQSPYAESKRQAEIICQDYARSYGVQAIILRSFNTYGPFQNNQRYGSVIPIFFKKVYLNEPPEIHGVGDQTRDFMYITDALDAYRLIFEKAIPGVPIHFGSGEEISINKLAEKIISLAGSTLKPIHVKPRPHEVMRLKADISAARDLGFNPKIKIDQGLKLYWDWFKENHSLYFAGGLSS